MAAAFAWWSHRSSQPEVRRPGEDLPDITERLARGLPEQAPTPQLVDVTEEAGLADFRNFVGDRTSQLPEDMGAGAAWGDYDGDGDDDLFLVSAGGSMDLPAEEWTPSRLYENLGDGSFRLNTDFPELRIQGMGAAWGDYDGDGQLDLAVSGYQALRLFRNHGGRFVAVDSVPDLPGYWAGLRWVDVDNDRDLDLYVSGYVQYRVDDSAVREVSEQYGTSVPYTLNPASFEPERNLLFENKGSGVFEEVALLYGVSNPEGRSLGALWHDFDQDGLTDVYIANDISDNALYLNRGDTFEDAGLAAWVADYRGAMGLAAADWNRDGDDDLFVTHWIAQENALYDSRLKNLPDDAPEDAVRLTFSDLAAPLGLGQIALHKIGWGTEFADLDGDGWLDLLVANGSTLETKDSPPRLKPQAAMVLWNQQGEYFHDLAPLHEGLNSPRVGRGLALSDYDLDGDLDVLIVDLGEGVRLYRNDMHRGNRLTLHLRSRGADSAASGRGEGATAVVSAGGTEYRRSVSGASYLSQSTAALHFSLADAETIDSVEVRWPGGAAESYSGITVNGRWQLTEGDPVPRRLDPDGPVDERQQTVAFWEAQRAAMDAIKYERDCDKAIRLFGRALALRPSHGDSRYYLANCLAARGDTDAALAELTTLLEYNPRSHRANKQRGTLRALVAQGQQDLEAAREDLERSLEINREETGSLLVLGEVAILQGDEEAAEQYLAWACRTNPKAVGGFFLRAYLADRRGERSASRTLLEQAHAARGEEWKPEGAVAEGDVAFRMHEEQTPLSRFWKRWDGTFEDIAFVDLDAYLGGWRSSRNARLN